MGERNDYHAKLPSAVFASIALSGLILSLILYVNTRHGGRERKKDPTVATGETSRI